MKIKTNLKIKKILLSFIFVFACVLSYAQDLYFEAPEALTAQNTQFPVVVNADNKNYLFFEENRDGKLYVQFIKKGDFEDSWSAPETVAGPFAFYGEVPDIYTAAALDNGTLCVALTESQYEIGIFTSTDGGESFSHVKLSMADKRLVAPRIFKTKNNSFVLFASLSEDNKFSIAYSTSSDGKKWSGFEQFLPAGGLDNSFSPYLCPVDGGDMVVFQSHFSVPDKPKTFQLYTTVSTDGLKTFSPALLLTDDRATVSRRVNSFIEYSNQSPVIYSSSGDLWCAWERNEARSDSTYISLLKLKADGTIEENSRIREYSDLRSSHRPLFFKYKNSTFVLWFDNSGAYSAQKMVSETFGAERLIKNSGGAGFVYPVVFNSNSELSYVWQKKEKTPRIFVVNQDKYAASPKLTPVNFRETKRSTRQKIKVSLTIPKDTNGIAAYSFSFSSDPDAEPSVRDPDIIIEKNIASGKSYTLTAEAEGDGQYYFKAKVLDVAGNWSKSSVLKYYRDLTPPKECELLPFKKDDFGFAAENSFALNWKKNETDDDVAGYSWTFTKIRELDSRFKDSKERPLRVNAEKKAEIQKYLEEIEQNKERLVKKGAKLPHSVKTVKNSLSFTNQKNGIYVFSFCAIDEAGNMGPVTSEILVLNKYKAHTVLSGLEKKKDEFGSLELTLHGQDFNYDGHIDEIYVEKAGDPFSKKTFYYDNGDFKIPSSTLITGLVLEDLEEGTYTVRLHHSERGLCKTARQGADTFTVDESGTVKIEHPFELTAEWNATSTDRKFSIQVVDLLFIILAALCLLAVIFAVCGIIGIIKESMLIAAEVESLLTGEIMPLNKKEKVQKLNKRKTGLKLKLVGFTILLVLAIVVMVSVSLGRRMIQTQRQTLVESMQEQVIVLMEGMANSVQNAMNDAVEGGSSVGLIDLIRQTNTFKPAVYASLMGQALDSKDTNLDYYWASTETSDSLRDKLDTPQPLYGRSRFKNGTAEAEIAVLCAGLEEEAHSQVDSILEEIAEKYSVEKKDEYTQLLRSLSRSVTQALPLFNEKSLENGDSVYTFYYPVFYKNNNDSTLLHAVLVLQVSAVELISSIVKSKMAIITIASIVAVVALVLGSIGAWILASLIVEPIKKLMTHVKVITETKDKKQLKNFEIHVKSHDEIGTLGDAVNEMTSGLVRAAEEEEKALEQEKMSLDAKAVQQTFLPLSLSDRGGKQTTAVEKEKDFELFGYYEGADAVSGDYFDYKKLDERFLAIIKCDVSGHGVPAALIMTVVATLFRKYFEKWTFKTHGTKLDTLALQINDFIESLGVKGKFATLLLSLFDTKTGDVYLCNAGDNIVHTFSRKNLKMNTNTLHEAPAAGPLPSFMVEMKGGFKVEKAHLESGDILFLYTDGIEESTRFFRDSDFNKTVCAEEGIKEGEVHENHKKGQESEQLEYERVQAILEALLNHKKYVLKKYHSPDAGEELVFDFTKLSGSTEEAITALVAVEKVFRMYKTPEAKGEVVRGENNEVKISGDTIRVDRKIDSFLKKTFNRYDYYCAGVVDMEESNYVYYTGVNEDPQADDLTLLAVTKL